VELAFAVVPGVEVDSDESDEGHYSSMFYQAATKVYSFAQSLYPLAFRFRFLVEKQSVEWDSESWYYQRGA